MAFISRTKSFLCLFLLWAGVLPAQAQILCAQTHLLKQNPGLHELLQKPLSKRVASSELTKKLSQKMIASMQESIDQGTLEGALGFSSPVEMWGQFQQRGTTLRVNIVQLYLRSQGSTMSVGERTQGLGLQFASFVEASLEASQFWVSRHPEVEKIEFRGNEIQSPYLPEILQRLGFDATSSDGDSMRLLIDARS